MAGTLGFGYGGTGATSRQTAINALAGAVTSGYYLRGDGTNIVLSAIQATDVPTLNQSTTGSAGSVANSATFNNSGTGAASGTTFDGSAARTISYNTLGASPLAGSSSLTTTGTVTSGTWSGSFGAVSGANLTSLTAGNLSGTIPSAVLGNSSLFVGTTSIALNRASASQGLTGVSSIAGLTGTASVSPLSFTSGTNLTTAAAGAVEYDGNVFYATPSTSTGRALVPAANFFRLNADLAGTTATTAQKVFGVGLTVAASTIYEFEYVYVFSKTLGTTTHSVSVNFGGSATFNNALHTVTETTTNTTGTVAALQYVITLSTNISYSVGTTQVVALTAIGRGTVSVNASGTFIPQYTLSANPGGAYSTLAGSYFSMWPVGASGANSSIGAWA